MAKQDDRLIVYGKMYKLIFYTKKLLMKYPKSERFDLCNEIKKIEITCLEKVMYAWKETEDLRRYELLLDADVQLYVLKTYVRMSYELKYITDKNFMAWDSQIDEIGKLLGSWRKKCQKE